MTSPWKQYVCIYPFYLEFLFNSRNFYFEGAVPFVETLPIMAEIVPLNILGLHIDPFEESSHAFVILC
jgi:hypothetical protein